MKSKITVWKSLIVGLTILLANTGAQAAPAHCSYGYQDSSCLTPQYRAAQTAPTCSSDAGWVTVTPAKWMGSGFTSPQCSYVAAPGCPSGFDVAVAPTWTGAGWTAPACVAAAPPPPPDPQVVCTAAIAAMSMRFTSFNYASAATVTGASLTQTSSWIQVADSPDWSHDWVFPGYTIHDFNGTSDNWNDSIALKSSHSDAYYRASFTGPPYFGQDYEDNGNPWRGYVGVCAINTSGALDGAYFMMYYPQFYSSN
ncbi:MULTISPECIES: hypothetical protein [unclassified Paraburkholderia]|uniref:hypothetical protein n=1 Tax=unclassified Paraburkholderia TaxID=2615204 RepID=UPI002AAFE9DA|nr:MULTISPECIES: hypothetical protein [unclassified Paraburkholderia]